MGKAITDKAVAARIEADVKAALPGARVRRRLLDFRSRDMTFRYAVVVTVKDTETGIEESRAIREPDEDVAAICKEMSEALHTRTDQ